VAAEQLRVEPARALVGHVAVSDFAVAAPLVAAASLLAGSELTLHEVPLEPGRSGFLDVLEHMGGRVAIFNRRRGGRPTGDVEVRPGELVAVTVKGEEARALLDDLPLVGLVAGSARGDSVVLTDRLGEVEREWVESVRIALRALGIRAQERDDGLGVRGVPTRPKGGGMDPRGDPRLALLGVVAGLVSREGVVLKEPDLVAVSFPGFFDLLESVTQR
jgi:3-phosphoshikimate 1-carboxyvinyltransferase